MAKEKKKKEFNFHQFMVAIIRASFKKTPMYKAALDAAKEEYFELSKTGKPMRRTRYVCAECNRRFREKMLPGPLTVIDNFVVPDYTGLSEEEVKKRKSKADTEGNKIRGVKMIAVDHIDPIIDILTGFTNWHDYIMKSMYGKLQVLCNYPGEIGGQKSCHKLKTAAERAVLAETKRNKKNAKTGI